jgi:hypothetical protein
MCTPSGYVLSSSQPASQPAAAIIFLTRMVNVFLLHTHTHTLVLFQQVRLKAIYAMIIEILYTFGEGRKIFKKREMKRKIIQIGVVLTPKPFRLTLAAILEVFHRKGEKMNVSFLFKKAFLEWRMMQRKEKKMLIIFFFFWLRLVRHYYYLVSCRQHTWCSEER